MLKENVIQLPNGKFIRKAKTTGNYYSIYASKAYTFIEKCISGIDINKMTNKEKSIIVDHYLGLLKDDDGVLKKYRIKTQKETIQQ